MSDIKFIGFFDILGFKDLVRNNSHQKLVELYEKLFSPMIAICLARGDIKIIENGQEKYWEPGYDKIDVNSLVISDSVIIWTDNNSMKSFVDILSCARTILNHSFLTGFPLRGAIVEGELKVLKGNFKSQKDNTVSTLIGKGLVDAYNLENEQNWSGCIVDERCIETYSNYFSEYKNSVIDLADVDYLVQKKIILKYQIPFKSGKPLERYAVDWINLNNKDAFKDESNVREKFAQYEKSTDDWKIEQLIRNTLIFIKSALQP